MATGCVFGDSRTVVADLVLLGAQVRPVCLHHALRDAEGTVVWREDHGAPRRRHPLSLIAESWGDTVRRWGLGPVYDLPRQSLFHYWAQNTMRVSTASMLGARVVSSPSVPRNQVQFRHPSTGRLLLRVINLGDG